MYDPTVNKYLTNENFWANEFVVILLNLSDMVIGPSVILIFAITVKKKLI